MDVAVFGAGVAGMTVAHELAERGFDVDLYERNETVGGKARSFGKPGTGMNGNMDLPGQHGFRFYPGFYKHVPEVMSRIPIGNNRTVADNLVDVEFSNIYFDNAPQFTFPSNFLNINTPVEFGAVLASIFDLQNVGLAPDDSFFFAERMVCALGSCIERREKDYELMSWADFIRVEERGAAYKRVFADGLARPLVAMNPEESNARTALTIMLQLFQNMVIPGQSSDRILNDPTSMAWIDPWDAHLTNLGVTTHTDTEVTAIQMAAGAISGVDITTGGVNATITADYYVFALPHEALQPLLNMQVLTAAPSLQALSSLENAWMTGLMFYLDGPNERDDGHAIYADSPWALTSIWELQFWDTVTTANIGDGTITALLSSIISNWEKPGDLSGKTADQCTRQEIIDEVVHELNRHLINSPEGEIDPTRIKDVFLDPAIEFDPITEIVSGNREELLINTVDSWKNRPGVQTEIANMLLAGDYVRTNTNLATMEGACEAGRLAATQILMAEGWANGAFPETYPLQEPAFFEAAKLNDRVRFDFGLPPLCLSTIFQLQRQVSNYPDLPSESKI